MTFDPVGNLLTATDSATGPLAFSYDALDRRTSETGGQGTITSTYDAASRRQAMQASGLPPVTYGYDANSRLTGLTQGTQSAGLTYDVANRRTTLTLPNGIVLSYTYDAASRLIGQTYTGGSGVLGDLTYGYDANGNRLTTGGSFARSGLPIAVLASAYDTANQQLTFGSVTQTFDANGNLLTQTDATGTTSYTWDARNRLTALTGPTVNATFAYDALGRRTTKTLNGQSTAYLYDGLDAVQESGPDGDASYLRTLGIDEALSRTDATGTLTYLADALGSTLALADSGGGLPTSYTYAPFGETSVSGLPSSSPFQFTGRENDGTGLYYYRARYYDPLRSRFISEDPIGFLGGENSYLYAGANPLLFIDPLGLMEIQVCLREQRLKLYGDNGNQLLDVRAKTGCSTTSTPTGTFKAGNWVRDPVNRKYSGPDPWRENPWSNPYGPWFLPLQGAGGSGIHGTRGPRWLGDTLIRMPDCSHGCVRISNSSIEKLHDVLPKPNGTRVTIKESCE